MNKGGSKKKGNTDREGREGNKERISCELDA